MKTSNFDPRIPIDSADRSNSSFLISTRHSQLLFEAAPFVARGRRGREKLLDADVGQISGYSSLQSVGVKIASGESGWGNPDIERGAGFDEEKADVIEGNPA